MQEQFLPHRMQPHGLQGLLEHQTNSMESPTETDYSWQWVNQEPSSPLRMESLGLQELREHRIFSKESHTETVDS